MKDSEDVETGETGGTPAKPERVRRGRAADVLTGQVPISHVLGKAQTVIPEAVIPEALPPAEEPKRFPWDDRPNSQAQVHPLTPEEFEELQERFKKFLGE